PRSKALSSQGPGAFSFARGYARDIQRLRVIRREGIPSGELCSPTTGTVFPFFLEGELHVYSKRSQYVSTDWRSARRPIRAATCGRAETCWVRRARGAEPTRRSRRSDAFDWPRFRRYALNGRSS